MIKVTKTASGVTIELASRQPMVYLDQWALYRFATNARLRRRFLDALDGRGTLLFSWMNINEIATTSTDTSKRISGFLHEIGENWLPLEMNPYRVMQKEDAYTPGDASPCLSESLVKEYYPHVHGKPLTLGRMVELAAKEGDGARRQLGQLKDTVLELTKKVRSKEKANPGWAARTYEARPFDAAKPTRFVYAGLFRELATNRGWTLTPNDGIDLFHCMVATAYSDMVLLDEPWTKRVRALRLPTNRVRAYYEGDLDLFLRDFATGLLPVKKAASPKSRLADVAGRANDDHAASRKTR
jgi:hypothetical protein